MRATLFENRKWGALAIGGVLLISLATPVNAAVPKAGATCAKKNATATSAGKIYTCILSGKKLVWNQGVAAATSSKTPEVAPTKNDSKNLLAEDSRITDRSLLENVEICKTTDNTPEYRAKGALIYRNGFPRPSEAIAGKKNAKLLIIPMSFKDLPFKAEKVQSGQIFVSDIESMNQVIPQVKDLFKKVSNGRFSIEIEVLPKSEWWNFSSNNPFGFAWGTPNTPRLAELITKEKSDFKFDGFDAYAFLAGNSLGTMPAQAAFAQPVTNSKNGYFSGLLMVGAFHDPAVWVHELGHALFALEDLYAFTPAAGKAKVTDSVLPTGWDLMANTLKTKLLRWNQLLMGWISDSEVRCLSSQKNSTHYLSTTDTNNESKFLAINLAEGVTLGAEARPGIGSESGLLLYTVDSNIAHGQGPIMTQKALLRKGQKKNMLGWQFTVLDTNTEGILISVDKTDVDKYVPPAKPTSPVQPEPQPSQPSGPVPTQSPKPSPNPKPSVAPPPIDRNSNVDGKGCSHGEPDLINSFGTFACTELEGGNNLWKKKS